MLTSCLTAVKKHVIKYCEKVYERSGKNLFWSIKNSGEILDKLKARDFNATSLSTYDFSTLYTTLPHNLIKDKLIDLIERTFQREGSPYLACSDRNAFFTSEKPKKYHAWLCQNVCDALTFLLDNIFIRFGTKLYRQVVGIPMGTNCAPLVADLFLFCYERDFMMSLSDDKQADVIDAFNTTSRYLDDILNINNVYFENMVSQIYPSELQLNKANASDTEAAFLYPPQTLFVGGILFSRCPSVRASVLPSVRPSVTLCFLNNSKSHCRIFIKPFKHVHICKTNTLDKKVRARGQFY